MSIWIAKLLGPVVIVLGIHMLTAPKQLQKTTEQFLKDGPLIFVSGVLAMIAGLSIVNSHNIWTWDWRVIITLFGWAFFLSGASRIIAPQTIKEVGDTMMNRPTMTRIAGVFWGAFGLFIAYKGYS